MKYRIMSQSGHLSNDVAADLIIDLIESDRAPSVWLSHLSKTNNSPSIALATAQHLLWKYCGERADISVALRDIPSLHWIGNDG